MRLQPFALACGLVLLACPPSTVSPSGPGPEEALAQERAATRAQLERIAGHAEALIRARETALWKAATSQKPLDLSATKAPLEALASAPWPEAFDDVALDAGISAGALRVFVRGERLAQELRDVDARLAAAEDGLVVKAGAREVRWRDLHRTLAAEASALTRRELWAGRVGALPPLVELHGERSQVVERWAGDAGVLSLLALDGAALKAAAEAELTDVDADAGFARAFADYGAAQLGLPAAQLSQADLPRLVKLVPDEERLLDEGRQKKLLEAAARNLGLADAGVVVTPGHGTLPMAVAPEGQVLVVARATPGVVPLRLILSELGRAARWSRGDARPLARLAQEIPAERTATLARALASEPAWLAMESGLDGTPAVRLATRATWLERFERRRLAAMCLVSLASLEGEAAARTAFSTWVPKALGVPVPETEASTWRLWVDPTFSFAPRVLAWREGER